MVHTVVVCKMADGSSATSVAGFLPISVDRINWKQRLSSQAWRVLMFSEQGQIHPHMQRFLDELQVFVPLAPKWGTQHVSGVCCPVLT